MTSHSSMDSLRPYAPTEGHRVNPPVYPRVRSNNPGLFMNLRVEGKVGG